MDNRGMAWLDEVELSMADKKLLKLNQEILKLNREAWKLDREASKLDRETAWYPVVAGAAAFAALMGAMLGLIRLLF